MSRSRRLRIEAAAAATHRQALAGRLHRADAHRCRHRDPPEDCSSACSIRSSPPRRSGSAPAWACRWCTASLTERRRRDRRRHESSARAPRSRCTCREAATRSAKVADESRPLPRGERPARARGRRRGAAGAPRHGDAREPGLPRRSASPRASMRCRNSAPNPGRFDAILTDERMPGADRLGHHPRGAPHQPVDSRSC